MSTGELRIGCAGWNIPRREKDRLTAGGSHLERYARALPAVEINSSFYRPHRAATYARWAATAPPGFRFAVKMPKTITHEARLAGTDTLLDAFLGETAALGAARGVLLVQLPPGLGFDLAVARDFFAGLRERHAGPVACEPRHPGWFAPEAETLLREMQVARVAADPAPVPAAASPGGWEGLIYHRLHGSPKIYYSNYTAESLARLSVALLEQRAAGAEVWCIFDNTAVGAAMTNALDVFDRTRNAG